LILIETAEDGRVTAIDTAGVVEGENTLQVHVKRERTLWTRTLAGNGRIPMDGNTVIFVIPPPDLLNPEEEDYQVLTNTEGPTTATLYTTSYKTKEKVGCEQYVVVEWEPRNQTFSQIPILVEEIHTTRNTDGEEVQMLVGYQGKTAVSLLLDENVKYADNRETIVPGSLIHATVGKNGTIIAVDEYCNPQRAENKEKLYDAITNISDVVMGSVLDVVDTVVKIDARDGEDTDARINCASATVLFWDSQQRNTKIRPGTIGEILPEDYAVVELNYTNPRLLIVYR